MACIACRKPVRVGAQTSGVDRAGWDVNRGTEEQRPRGGTKDPEHVQVRASVSMTGGTPCLCRRCGYLRPQFRRLCFYLRYCKRQRYPNLFFEPTQHRFCCFCVTVRSTVS